MECFLTKYTCPFCRFCLGKWKSAPVSDLPKSHYQYIYSVTCITDVSRPKREAAGSRDLCSEQSDQIRRFDFHKVMSCFGSHWGPELPLSRALGIRVDRRLLPSANPLVVCPRNGCFSKYLLVLSLHLELVLHLGDPGISQNLEKIAPYVQYKTGTYKLPETITSIQRKMASTLESV